MIRCNKIVLSVLVAVGLIGVSLIAWAPWITEEYVYAKVIEHLGGSDALFNYLGETMPLSEAPKSFKKLPFVSFVYFPSEVMLIVTFYGGV